MNRGLSLVELSIILVIVGLIAGGIIVGQNVLRASEIRSLGTQGEEIERALLLFKTKYKAIPGDFRRATDIWGAADGADGLGADCTTVVNDGSSTATCNGNGNAEIQQQPGSAFRYETWRAWQHLSNAGLIPGVFTGVAHTPSSTNREAVPGENVPETNFDAVGFTLLYKDSSLWTNWFLNEFDTHVATVGQRSNVETRDPFLSPSEMVSLESKFDDGKPGSGRIQTWTSGSLPNCVSSTDPATATYLISNNEISDACSFYVVFPW